MSTEEIKPDSNIKATIDAVTGLVTAIPIYQDAIQPSAQQIGKSLETITKTVNIALAPIKALVWGYEQVEQFISSKVTEKLRGIPEENIITPIPQIAGPAVEALRYTGHDVNLRELFANLLANAMDKETAHSVHPSYVEIIKNISSDEAILLSAFITTKVYPIININSKYKDIKKGYRLIYPKYSHIDKIISLTRPDLIPVYVDNLCRLGVLESPKGIFMTSENIYEPLENDSELDEIKKSIVESACEVSFDREIVRPTSFGSYFIDNVVIEKK